MFKRRKPKSLRQKFNNMLWPKMGWKRMRSYYKHRMGRLPGTPYFIAGGLATGIAVSLTPFLGLHIFLGATFCWLFRQSMIAMVFGTLIGGNPWSFPVIWLGTYYLGHLMLGHTDVFDSVGSDMGMETAGDPWALSFSTLFDNPMELLLPMTLGSLPLILPIWFVAFYLARRLVTRYQAARLARIREKQRYRGKAG
ncbi:MAG TPA: DUF2062 domain-containing protein [Alphaproteobacteria bacterium]|nr:DUF2062 domain-containing protein [Alphaproteobacteria bacterium]